MELNEDLLQAVVAIAKGAGKELLTIYNNQTPLNITAKFDQSPVTLADLTANRYITDSLKELTPHIPILSEEDDNFDFDRRRHWETFWLIDPLDGTKEYIERTGQFTVNIALISNSKPVLGVIYIPLKDQTYCAAEGLGAFKYTSNDIAQLGVRPWQMNQDLTLVATRRELHNQLQEKLNKFGKINVTYRSSSIKFCLLAEGRGDIYLRYNPIYEWDTGAGQAILEIAGGLVLDSNWQTLRYNTGSNLLSAPFVALGDWHQLLPILKSLSLFKEFE